MQTSARPTSIRRRLAGIAVASAAVLSVTAAPAGAASVTYTGSAGTSVTLSTGSITAGLPATQRIAITGTGFVGINPDAQGTPNPSQPVVAVKFNRADTLVNWGSDAGDRVTVPTVPNTATFKASLDTGSFSGWIDVPLNVSAAGSGLQPFPARHIVNVLSGSLSTTTSAGPPAVTGNTTASGISIPAYVDAFAQPETGYQQSASSTFYPGTFLPTGFSTPLKVTGSHLDPSATVTVKLDGVAVPNPRNFGTQVALTTDASGDFTAGVNVLTTPVPGVKVLTFTTGETSQSVALTTTSRSAVRTSPATAAPGDTVAVTGTGFRSISGAGQNVGLVIQPGDTKIACAKADDTGAVTIAGQLPNTTSLGQKSLLLVVGTNCDPANGIVEPVNGLVPLSGLLGVNVANLPDYPTLTPTPTPTATATPTPTATPAPTAPTAAPAPTPIVATATPTPSATPTPTPQAPKPSKVKTIDKGASIQVTLATGAGTSVKVSARTSAKYKLTTNGKAKTVTVVKATTVKASKGTTPTVSLKLTADGKKLLKRKKSLKVVVTITLPGGGTTTKTFTLKG